MYQLGNSRKNLEYIFLQNQEEFDAMKFGKGGMGGTTAVLLFLAVFYYLLTV